MQQRSQQWCSIRAAPYFKGTSCLTQSQLNLLWRRGLEAKQIPYKSLPNRKKASLWDALEGTALTSGSAPEYQWPYKSRLTLRPEERVAAVDRMDQRFRPAAPPAGQWLDSANIQDYLAMLVNSRYRGVYTTAYPSAAPSDSKLWPSTYLGPIGLHRGKKSANQYQKTLDKLAKTPWKRYIVVLNLGKLSKTSGGGGSHWVVIYLDRTAKTPGLEYFDSMHPGGPLVTSPSGKLWYQFQQWNSQGLFGKKPLPVKVNQHKAQKRGIECGMFVIWFVTNRVRGESMASLDKSGRATDESCAKLRHEYYRAPPTKKK